MKVRNPSITKLTVANCCRLETILSGGRNLVELTIGPPKKDSMTVGTCTSGIASLGISVLDLRRPAAFFLLGADDRTFLPSYRWDVSPPPSVSTSSAIQTPLESPSPR